MSYEVIIPKPVQKQLKNLPPTINERVLEKILYFPRQPTL
ncbi:type II toxin-antitoxin system RelE/ParE family toxin [Aphanizomenon sp. UHCC 0183]